MQPFEIVLWLLAAVVSGLVFFIPWLLGLYLLYVGKRCKKSAGSSLDQTAFWFNFIAFMWMWAERIKEIIAAMPFFEKDLSETLGIKPDDHRIT